MKIGVFVTAAIGLIGITDLNVIHIEGVANRAIGLKQALAAATAQSRQILAQIA
jgi:hypothetical protein